MFLLKITEDQLRVILNKHVLLMLAGQLVFQTQWLTDVFVAQYGNTVKPT